MVSSSAVPADLESLESKRKELGSDLAVVDEQAAIVAARQKEIRLAMSAIDSQIGGVKASLAVKRAANLAANGDEYRSAKAAVNRNRLRIKAVESELEVLPAEIAERKRALESAKAAKQSLHVTSDDSTRKQLDRDVDYTARKLASAENQQVELQAELVQLQRAMPRLEAKLSEADLALVA